MTKDEAKAAFREWLDLKDRWEEHYDGRVSAADVDHSSLLDRLLSGDGAFPKPPPRRYSYPDYELAEGEPVEVAEVYDSGDALVLDQSVWDVVERRDGATLLKWSESGEHYWLRGNVLQRAAAPPDTGRERECGTT